MNHRKASPTAAIAAVSILIILALAIFNGCSSSSGSGTGGTKPPQQHYLAVADANNARVLIYDSPFSTGQSASVVLGQADFTSAVNATSATGMGCPGVTAVDSAGDLWVSDMCNNRVLQFKPPFTTGMAASLVLGQLTFDTGTANTTMQGLSRPIGLVFDKSGNLWVADASNCRLLQFEPPFSNGMSASYVIGQTSFTTKTCSTTNSELAEPSYIAFDSGGNLWVSDLANNRVLEFQPPFTNGGMAASLVIGQEGFDTGTNVEPPTASSLFYPQGVAFDSTGNLWIGDSNSRVLQYQPPFSNGMSATLVLGQADFTSHACTTTQNGLCTEDSGDDIAFDSSGNLWVVDDDNSRTVEFTPPFSTNQNAALALGQANFTSGGGTTTATGQYWPIGVTAF